jgi:hypothetical protein
MAWISFSVFDLGSAVTGGLFTGIGEGLDYVFDSLLPANLAFLKILSGGILGIMLITIFPIHWLLQYRPDEPVFAVAMLVPWVLCIFITAILFAKNTKEGFWVGIKLGIAYLVPGAAIFAALPLLPDPAGSIAEGISSGIFAGLTDLPYPWLAITLACLEGSFIGAVFGALAGALKYKPDASYEPKKSKRSKKSKTASASPAEPSYGAYSAASVSGSSAKSDFCTNCGAKLQPGMDFCTSCGQRIQ